MGNSIERVPDKCVFDRRAVLHAGVAAGAALLIPAARACEVAVGHFTIVHPWTLASARTATSAIVCMTFQDVTQTDRLIGAQSMVATSADMGGQAAAPGVNFVIHSQQTSVLHEDGVHLRLLGLKFPLQQGREYPMTLVFEKAGAVHTTLSVDFERPA